MSKNPFLQLPQAQSPNSTAGGSPVPAAPGGDRGPRCLPQVLLAPRRPCGLWWPGSHSRPALTSCLNLWEQGLAPPLIGGFPTFPKLLHLLIHGPHALFPFLAACMSPAVHGGHSHCESLHFPAVPVCVELPATLRCLRSGSRLPCAHSSPWPRALSEGSFLAYGVFCTLLPAPPATGY